MLRGARCAPMSTTHGVQRDRAGGSRNVRGSHAITQDVAAIRAAT